VGHGGSGKDYARKLFESRGFKYATSYTTRPSRTGETNGVDYFFITEEMFRNMIKNDMFYEYVSFNGWFYGTSMEQFYTNDVFIMTPSGISKIKPEDRKHSFVIYFNIAENVRRERLSQRNDADNVDRRILADIADFKNFTDYDFHVIDPYF
jgi:guanylate kinase